MKRVLAAEAAILIKLKLIGGILLVLNGVVVPLLALAAPEYNFNSHFSAPP